MKIKGLLVLICVLHVVLVTAQDSPIPIQMQTTLPTPTAMAFHKAGNTDVGMYSGTNNVSLPLANASVKNISSPVTLNYSSGGGIKVEEVATWVGIGWTLNAGGSVSRAIRGKIDDESGGYIFSTALPDDASEYPDNTEIKDQIDNIAEGDIDGEPDKFFYNAGGVSGSFFIRKDQTIMQVPESDVKIVPLIYSTDSQLNQQIQLEEDVTDQVAGRIYGFEIYNVDGMKYTFKAMELSHSKMVGGNDLDSRFKVSSWMLTEISHPSHKRSIKFSYERYRTTLVSESIRNVVVPGENYHSYSEATSYALRLKTIDYVNGTINFNAGVNRCDFKDDKVLESIEVRNTSLDLLKKYTFEYSYFTPLGVQNSLDPCGADDNTNHGAPDDGDYTKRLKLDRIVEWDRHEVESIVYASFEYDLSHYLPDRHSFSKDHWGYYNGKNNGTSREAKNSTDIYIPSTGQNVTMMFGSADREADPEYARAGILKKINYATGGYTEFFYEGNQVNIEGDVYQRRYGMPVFFGEEDKEVPYNANMPLYADVNAEKIDLTFQTGTMFGSGCRPLIRLSKSGRSTYVYLESQNGGNKWTSTRSVDPGNYITQLQYIDVSEETSCEVELIPDKFYNREWSYLTSEWAEDVLVGQLSVRDVGGLRIKKIIDSKGYGHKSSIYEYDYLQAEDGRSSGSLINEPKYGYLNVSLNNDPSQWSEEFVNLAWVRTYQTTLPLAFTKGGVVGYSRVIKRQVNEEGESNGYSVFEYSSPADYGDKYSGWTHSKSLGDDQINNNGDIIDVWPPAIPDTREWQRGVLLKQQDYGLVDQEPRLLKETIYDYKFYAPQNPELSSLHALKGHVQGMTYLRFYEQSTQRNELNGVTTILYDPNDPSRTQTQAVSYQYEGFPYHYLRSKETWTDNLGKTIETNYRYAGDFLSGASPVIQQMNDQGMKGILLEQNEKVDGQVTKGSATRYVAFDDMILSEEYYKYEPITLSAIEPSINLGNDYSDYRSLAIADYDIEGNIIELEQSNGSTTSYLWGFYGAYVIRKTENGVLETNYAYEEGRGLISVTDPNGKVTRYEYDDFGRLKNVRDDANNIIERNSYKYHNQ